MGRELRRKQAKKNGKSLEREEVIETNQIKKLLINVFVVVGIFAIIYLISALFITKELDWFDNGGKDDTEDTSTSGAILASAIFNQKEEEYYVYFYNFDEKEEESTITSLVTSSLTDSKVYKVNTKSAMNANYVGDAGNKSAKKLDDLKVVAPTLIKIKGDTIAEYYEKDEITKKLS